MSFKALRICARNWRVERVQNFKEFEDNSNRAHRWSLWSILPYFKRDLWSSSSGEGTPCESTSFREKIVSDSNQPQHILRELDEVNNLSQDLAQKASTASPPPLTLDQLALTPLERDIVNCINDKSTDENIATGVHVADFIPDVIQLNPELTSEELRCAIEVFAQNSVLTIFKVWCWTAFWIEKFYTHLIVMNITVAPFRCLPAYWDFYLPCITCTYEVIFI